MTGTVLNIGRTGLAAARAGIELTAQNIANADNANYARRTLGRSEVVLSATIDLNPEESLGGVRASTINRAGDEFLQIEARTSQSDLARADAEIAALRDTETAIETSGLYETLVEFEAALTRLESDPLNPTLRTLALESARQLTDTFQLADRTLATAQSLTGTELSVGVDQVNTLTTQLADINTSLASARMGSARQAELLDARDAALRDLAGELAIAVAFDANGAAQVRLGGPAGEVLVQGNIATTLSASFATDGTATLALGGQAVTPQSGALAGRQAALAAQAIIRTDLDAAAAAVIAAGNAAQANGSTADGNPAAPLFSGTDARTIALALNDPRGLATAPVGAPAGSRDAQVLSGLIAAIGAADGPIAGTDALLSRLSSRISGLGTQREGLAIIAQSARSQLLSQTGVDLDTEAANLVRLQQAFEANSRVIQVAADLFDTILALR